MLSKDERTKLIDHYEAGYDAVMAALDGITPEELDAREGEGEWSPRQVAHHLADSEMTSAIRFRRIIVEDHPHIMGYDQDAYAAELFYDRPIEASLMAFRGARASTAPIMRALSDDQWQRAGSHSETGEVTAESLLEYYAEHAHGHAGQIRRARATVAKA